MVNLRPSAPLSRLLLGYAPSDARSRQALWWHWDERLAAILQGGREPAIMAIRLAWWRDVLVQGDEGKGRGEPLVEALRTTGLSDFDRQHIGRCVEGWGQIAGAEALSAEDLQAYAQGRGGGLFSLLAGQSSPAIVAAGGIWALWDLAAHLSDPELAAVCSKLGRIPTVAEYREAVGVLNQDAASVYKYMNFDQIEEYAETAKGVTA